MGNEYYPLRSQSVHDSRSKPQAASKPHRGGGPDPLLRELSALSRAPSLRDPSTSSVWRSGVGGSATAHGSSREGASRRRERETRGNFSTSRSKQHHHHHQQQQQEGVSEEEESDGEDDERGGDESLRTAWQEKVVNWIDGGLREGERKQELLRSISDLLTSKMESPSAANSNVKHKSQRPVNHSKRDHVGRRESDARQQPPGRIAWREAEVSYGMDEENQNSGKALALTRHSPDPGYDYDESESSSGDETDGLVSHSQSPLLSGIHKDRKGRRRKLANSNMGCTHFRLPLPHPYNNKSLVSKSGPDHLEGPETTHGCGLPWSYWSKHKGKNLLEMAGRSLSCGGYADIPRRKVTGQEIIPAPSTSYEHESNAGAGKRHRSMSQKYRPKTFKEMVGQTMLVQALTNAVTRGRVAPVYLFHGPRGTGKTSAAKILAAALNCVSLEDTRPCGVCRECLLLCLGKSADVKEVEFASQSGGSFVKKLLNDIGQPPSGRYKVFIIDECHTMTSEGWNGLLKCLEEPPEYAVFILTTTDPDQLPHLATTRCQKFHFPKIKDADIVTRLQMLAGKESMEAETDALELIAGRSNGSLRDAETTLEQLGLVGQRITLEVVQELIGLVSNAKLAELLDLALSGDTLNTVKCIREFMDSGVEPLALMSQIATLITDILAGGYTPTSDKGFFQRHTLTKDQLEKLRQALKTLSESEKQIRSSQDQTTWLTATLLQFAPDPHSGFPASSGTSGTPSVLAANDTSEKETIEWEPTQTKQSWDDFEHQQYNALSGQLHSLQLDTEHNNGFQEARPPYPTPDGDRGAQAIERHQKLADTWMRVLEVSQSSILKQLLWNHGRLLSITIEGGRAVAYLEFQQAEHRASAERSKTSISHAFQLVLGFPVEIRLRVTGETELTVKSDPAVEQNQFPGCTESKAPPSPTKPGVTQGEFLNSRSFPACVGKVKGDQGSDKASWDHVLEEFPSVKSYSSENQSDQDSKICAVQGGRQVFQLQGRRFKLKTVRNFSTDLTADGGRPAPVPEAKVQKTSGRQKHGTSLLCWKANKVDEDDEGDSVLEA